MATGAVVTMETLSLSVDAATAVTARKEQLLNWVCKSEKAIREQKLCTHSKTRCGPGRSEHTLRSTAPLPRIAAALQECLDVSKRMFHRHKDIYKIICHSRIIKQRRLSGEKGGSGPRSQDCPGSQCGL
ncbi:hypothetical protein WMY93_033769 [Mugilogobius chulae]|uniref:Uncharacterized protein n=1 Tax=Mugilogobius chulae TaxID=88201 RepID=A0AAW0MRU4_9GOBI